MRRWLDEQRQQRWWADREDLAGRSADEEDRRNAADDAKQGVSRWPSKGST